MNPIVIGATLLNFYCEISPTEVDYNLDNVLLEQKGNDDSWENDVDSKIDAIRKRKVQINFIDLDTSELSLEIVQKDHKFPFGHAVQSRLVQKLLLIPFMIYIFVDK